MLARHKVCRESFNGGSCLCFIFYSGMRVTVVAPDLAMGAGPIPGRIMSSDQAQPIVNGPVVQRSIKIEVLLCLLILKM